MKINEQKYGQQGLTQEVVKLHLEKFGHNTFASPGKKQTWDYLKEAMKDITILILLFATGLSCYVAFKTHPDDFTEPIVIFSIVLLNIVYLFGNKKVLKNQWMN